MPVPRPRCPRFESASLRSLSAGLPGASKDDIPVELKAAPQHFEIESTAKQGLEDLLRTLTGQPAYPRPAVGELPLLPPKSWPSPPAQSAPRQRPRKR